MVFMNFQPANLGKRILAYIIDSLVVGVVFVLLIWLAFALEDGILLGVFGMLSEFVRIMYFTLSEGSGAQTTLGKRAMGLKVVNIGGGEVSYLSAFLRAICFWISSIAMIGHIIALFTENNRTLHDIITGTAVAEAGVQMQTAAAPVYTPTPFFGGRTPVLIGLVGMYAGRTFPVGGGLILGTDPTICQIVLPAGRSGVSRNHCKVTFDMASHMFIIHDLGSTNGTFLENGQRVPQGVPFAVHPGTKIYLANKGTFFELRY